MRINHKQYNQIYHFGNQGHHEGKLAEAPGAFSSDATLPWMAGRETLVELKKKFTR